MTSNKVQFVFSEIAFAATLFVLGVASLYFVNRSTGDDLVTVNSQAFSVVVADDPAERNVGLSKTDTLKDDEGMLFVFEKPGIYSFWMKDMNFSIDIIWIDEARQVVHIEERVSPNSYPNESFVSTLESQYVLEISSGRADEIDLELGDLVEIDI